jgi:hemerythrin
MLNCETGNRVGKRKLTNRSRKRAGTFALVANFYTAARTQQDRRVLRDMLGQIISNLHDQFESEGRMLRCIRDSSLEAHERICTHVLAELQEFLDLAESEDAPLAKLAHAPDGLVIRQLRGELRLLS